MKSGPRRTALPSSTPSTKRTWLSRVQVATATATTTTWTRSATSRVPWIWSILLIATLIGSSAATLPTDLHKLEDSVDAVLANDRTLRLSKSLTLEALDVDRSKAAVNASKGDVVDRVVDKLEVLATTHALRVHLPELASDVRQVATPKFLGKNSFLAGFGLGFLAFGLKKLLLPVFIGLQIVKSVLIAMFLPSILGSVGKLVGKGVTTLASASGGAGGLSGGGALHGGDTMDDFDFKDTTSSAAASAAVYPDAQGSSSDLVTTYLDVNKPDQPPGTLPAAAMPTHSVNNRYQQKTSYAHGLTGMSGLRRPSYGGSPLVTNSLSDHGGSFYSRKPAHDFHKFHGIPSSSLLLAHYDPFYSPLLSRLDAVFQQLGYSSEACRERLVCAMYRNPAKFAPFSNLVSAQLSRELNELRKPSSDNPEILRFFRYMKAAKDGQDAVDCTTMYSSCNVPEQSNASSPMAHTFHDINKLVQARHMTQTR